MKDYDLDEMDLLTNNNSNSLVLFYADWCHYCSRFKPIFEETMKKNPGILTGGVKLNDDDNPLWDKYRINAVPTLIAFSNNSIKSRRDAKMGVGLTSSDLNSILLDINDKDGSK